MCYGANSMWTTYSKLQFAGEAYYCEGFAYDSNIHECVLYSTLHVAPDVGDHCWVSKELTNQCTLPRGVFVRDSQYKVYYSGDDTGVLFSVDQGTTCSGRDIWGGKTKPSFFCDGTVDSQCNTCIQTLFDHGKFEGEFSCDVYYERKLRICQYEKESLVCPPESEISVTS